MLYAYIPIYWFRDVELVQKQIRCVLKRVHRFKNVEEKLQQYNEL